MPRLFTALTVPDEARMWLTAVRGGLRSARWIEPENYHITLRFIGDVDEPTADEVHHALSRIERPPVTVTLNGYGSFGSKRPHSVFVRVEPSPQLLDLQAAQERALQRIGLPAEARKFTPHVTIARVKGSTAKEVAGWLSMRGDLQVAPYTAGEFVLMSSRDSYGGGPYVVEERYPLGLAAAA
ncbi:MAG: RNA 2',3'-cyclic phosphodiesterase [Pseudomonadota bacterium]